MLYWYTEIAKKFVWIEKQCVKQINNEARIAATSTEHLYIVYSSAFVYYTIEIIENISLIISQIVYLFVFRGSY